MGNSAAANKGVSGLLAIPMVIAPPSRAASIAAMVKAVIPLAATPMQISYWFGVSAAI